MRTQTYPHSVIQIPHTSCMENMQLRQTLAANLRKAMEDDTQAEVAKRAGVAQSHISRILRCEASATTDLIAALARALKLQPWELLADNEATRRAALERMLYGQAVAGDRKVEAPQKEVAYRRRKKGGRDAGDTAH